MESLLKVSRFLHRKPAIEVFGEDPARVVSICGSLSLLEEVLSTGRKLVRKQGAVTIKEVHNCISPRSYHPETFEFTKAVLCCAPNIKWLEKSSGWFTFSIEDRNVLKTRILKVLSVCENINASELHAALRRDNRLKGRVPPCRILVEYCHQLRECTVLGDQITSCIKLDFEELTKGDERTIIRLFQQHGPICSREDIQNRAEENGISHSSFWRCISFCPTITKFGRGVYGLSGATPVAGQIDALQSPIQEIDVSQDRGPRPAG